jgi:sulfite exporter TauE/SafE
LFLPVLGFDSQQEANSYIIGFGTGTVLAMAIFTMVLGQVSELAKNWHNPIFFRGIRVAGGLFALIIGVYWMLSY